MEQLFTFDSETGQLFWKSPPKRHPKLLGKEAGNAQHGRGNKFYWVIQVKGKKLKRSHIVYFLTHGKWPKPCIDHINGNSLDDRPCNLREATITENAWNHKFRARSINLPMGVRHTTYGKFQARISCNKKQHHLGVFNTAEEAHQVYLNKKKELYGKFA